MERIITVKGSIENMSRAESMVSSKLRQSYENDLQAMAVSILYSVFFKFINYFSVSHNFFVTLICFTLLMCYF